MIERAEEFVRSCGFIVFRVRYIAAPDGSASANLEVDSAETAKLGPSEESIREALRTIGFRSLFIDPKGYTAPSQMTPAH